MQTFSHLNQADIQQIKRQHSQWFMLEQNLYSTIRSFLFFHLECAFMLVMDFPCCSEVKASTCNMGDLGSIPGSGRSPGEGNGSPLQYSCRENPMDRRAWRAAVHGVTESDTTEQLSTHLQGERVPHSLPDSNPAAQPRSLGPHTVPTSAPHLHVSSL